jgi:hypothetical protein
MIPGVYPRDTALPTKSHAETAFFNALRKGGLPAGWYAWHSIRVRDEGKMFGEGDFVIAKPGHGFLVVEVKGGQIRCEGGHWYSNQHHLKRSPLDQAHSTHAKLRNQVKVLAKREPASGVAVSFPDTEFSNPPGRNDLRGIVLGAQDMGHLNYALEEVFERAVPATREGSPAESMPWIKALHHMWGESWTPVLRLGDRARIDEEKRVALDAAQLMVLDVIAANTRTHVSGNAGSGKTLLALESARRRAANGEHVLMLCFTNALAHWLREEVKGTTVTVHAVRQLAVELLRAQGGHVNTYAPGFWEDVSLRAAVEALPGADMAVDCVLVDEGQDLDESDWTLVEALADGKPLWCFSDKAQAFWAERTPPENLFALRLNLPNNHRAPAPLAELARGFAGEEVSAKTLEDIAQQGQLQLVACEREEDIARALEKQVDDLLRQGLKPGDIAILSLRGQTSPGSLFHMRKLGRHDLVHADDPTMTDHIVAETFLRFKGLERPAVLITDLRLLKPGEANQDVRMHIALTRALSTARVVATREALRAVPLLARLL